MSGDIVTGGDLGPEFDLGNIQTDKVRLKLGAGLAIQPDGTIVATSAFATTAVTAKSWNGATISDAQADLEATLCDALELSTGAILNTGAVTWTGHGLTVGAWYFLSQSVAGGVTDALPAAGWVQRLFFVSDADTVLVHVQEGYQL